MRDEAHIPTTDEIRGRWVYFRWTRSTCHTFRVREAWCQAVRGGEIAELSGGFFVSLNPTLMPIAEMELLCSQTQEERAADIATREPAKGDPMAYAQTGAPVGDQPVKWDEAAGRPIR